MAQHKYTLTFFHFLYTSKNRTKIEVWQIIDGVVSSIFLKSFNLNKFEKTINSFSNERQDFIIWSIKQSKNDNTKSNHMSHCAKSVRIRSYSGPHFPAFWLNTERDEVQMRENVDQNNCECGHFLRSVCNLKIVCYNFVLTIIINKFYYYWQIVIKIKN